jgi:hypothetical protein
VQTSQLLLESQVFVVEAADMEIQQEALVQQEAVMGQTLQQGVVPPRLVREAAVVVLAAATAATAKPAW